MINTIVIYNKDYCPYCKSAKALLQSKGLKYTEIDVQWQQDKWIEMVTRSHQRTVPQIFINDEYIGGSTDLHRYFANLENNARAA